MPAVASFSSGLALLALMLVASGWMLRRAARRPARAATERGVPQRADGVLRRIAEAEARLYDRDREAAAAYETRAAALRGLLGEIDDAAQRLHDAETDAVLPFSPHARAARSLKQAGYSDAQVEKLLARESDPFGDRDRRAA